MGEKQTKKSELTRSKILEAAEAEFSEKGLFGARIDNIAQISGVNKRMIYEHFDSKEFLYETTLLSVYERLAECERQFVICDLEPTLAIRNIIYVYFRFLEENPNFVRMLMWENLNGGRFLDERHRDTKSPALDYIRTLLKRGVKSGVFREDVDEHQIVVSIMNFGFSYFANMHTLSAILEREMKNHEEIMRRADFVSNIIIKFITKTN